MKKKSYLRPQPRAILKMVTTLGTLQKANKSFKKCYTLEKYKGIFLWEENFFTCKYDYTKMKHYIDFFILAQKA